MEESSHSTEDFRVFSLSIELITLIYGLFMVVWAFSISIIAESSSLTSLVPAFIGCPADTYWIYHNVQTDVKKSFNAYSCIDRYTRFFGWSRLF